MELALLLDIGSTYTKGTVVDLADVELKATAKALTTVQDDVTIGISNVLDKLEESGIDLATLEYRLACSSAAGGLKMVAIGLVPELTAEAANRAALGAGAKVANVYAYELTTAELQEISRLEPDVILLAGGTNGGNQDIISKNATALAKLDLAAPIVVAGNKVAADKVRNILERAGKEVYLTANVMPKLEELNAQPARKTIRQVFLDQIIQAKGLDQAKEYIDQVIMPTPAAVMKAAELLAEGTPQQAGLGELIVADIGGATTDLHSVATGEPTTAGVSRRGLEEPYVKRTVEGDLGMRYSAPSLVEVIGVEKLLSYLPQKVTKDRLGDYIKQVRADVEYLPNNKLEQKIDLGIAKAAIHLAIQRHVGHIETVYSPLGENHVQYGKDLTDLELIIGTGGVIVHNSQPAEILKEGLFTDQDPTVLAPQEPDLMLDQDYLLAAIGLLAEKAPNKAFRLATKHLKKLGREDNETKK
ncbi:methylaspartate mutase accessory protein GlmL [Halanaerobaculum tunisiense]